MTLNAGDSTLSSLIRKQLPDVELVSDPASVAEVSVDAYWKAIALQSVGRAQVADVVVRPTTTEQVAALVRLAGKCDTPVVTRGLGSGTQGGAFPHVGGLLIDVSGMNDVVNFDPVSGTVTVQPGIRGIDLDDWLSARGWFFPHYPASLHLASVGGYLASKGAGVLSTKYGTIQDLVASVEVVLPSGEIMTTCSVPRHSVGPDLNQLFIGSEGTLGVITETTLLISPQPELRLFRLVGFDNVAAGVDAMRRALQEGWDPSVVRLYDEDATSDHLAKPFDANVAGVKMVVGVEGPRMYTEAKMQGLLERLIKMGGTDEGSDVAEMWWQGRFRYYLPPFKPELPKLWGTADAVATYANIMPVYEVLGEALRDRYAQWNLRLTRHFSHWYRWGTMVYARFHIDEPPTDIDEALDLYDDIWRYSSRVIVKAGGVINHHHGVGLKLAEDMPLQHEQAWKLMRIIKNAVDEGGIMNPGKAGL